MLKKVLNYTFVKQSATMLQHLGSLNKRRLVTGLWSSREEELIR